MESLEQVEITATQQWDELLELAQQFAAMEVQLGPDTSEEEEEENLRENFIDDGDTETRSVAGPVLDTFRCLLLPAVLLRSTMRFLTPLMKMDRSRVK